MNPKITCVINVRNGESFILSAIQSVKKQTIPVNLLVVDNHSTDNTHEVVKTVSNLTLVKTPEPMSLGAARDFSLKFITTLYVSWLDCDDLWEPSFCEDSVSAFEKFPGLSIVSSGTILIDESGSTLPVKEQRLMVKEPAAGNYIEGDTLPKMLFKLRTEASWQAYVFKTHDIKGIGGFNRDLKFSVDADIIARLLAVGRSISIQKNLSRCRIHANQMTAKFNPEERFFEGYSVLVEAGKKAGLLNERKTRALLAIVQFRIRLARFQQEKSLGDGLRALLCLLNPFVATWFVRRMLSYGQY